MECVSMQDARLLTVDVACLQAFDHVNIAVLDTSYHTRTHVAYYCNILKDDTAPPALFAVGCTCYESVHFSQHGGGTG
jgi:hypothetical protein